MTVVSDSSPLIILAKLGCFDLLRRLFPVVCISAEVHREVVVAGMGLPGASEVDKAEWIETRSLENPSTLQAAQQKYALGSGELSTILLGKELRADTVLLDDHDARKLAKADGLRVRASVGLLEAFHLNGSLPDLRAAFQALLTHHIYIDRRLLNGRLRGLGIRPL